MKKKRPSEKQQWMTDLAEKHNISWETVHDFYMSLTPDSSLGTLKERTISFFDLYFEEVHNG